MGKPITTVEEALKYHKKFGVKVAENNGVYTLTNMGNYTWKVDSSEQLIYEANLCKNPPKVTSLVQELTKAFWE